MKKLIAHFAPTHVVYVLVHGIIFLSGVILVQFKSTAMISIGTSLIAAGAAGWVIFVYVLVTDAASSRLEIFSKFGLSNCFSGRSIRIKDEYDRRLSRAASHIDVMGFGLSALREDYQSEFTRWRDRAHVRVLLLDPDFPNADSSYANQRDREEGDSPSTIRNDVLQFIREVGPLTKRRSPHPFEIRLYRCIPAVNIFRIDDELFWGPYLVGEKSRNIPTFLVQNSGLLYRTLLAQFDRIWSSSELSRPLPEAWLTQPPQ